MSLTTSSKKASTVWDTIKTVLYAVGIALAIRTAAVEPFNIPSGSMIPTLLVGDYLFVSKFSYGYSRYSLPFGLPLIPGRVLYREPDRGDVAVFKLPRDNSTDYIKRIMGLPGDRLQMVGGVLTINGLPVKRDRVEDFLEGTGRAAQHYAQYVETLPSGRQHRIIEVSDDGPLDNTPVYIVPAGHYFAMGDNRDNSLDSRVLSGVGFIPAANLVGRAEFTFFSTNGEARIWEVWKWPFAIRLARMFRGIV